MSRDPCSPAIRSSQIDDYYGSVSGPSQPSPQDRPSLNAALEALSAAMQQLRSDHGSLQAAYGDRFRSGWGRVLNFEFCCGASSFADCSPKFKIQDTTPFALEARRYSSDVVLKLAVLGPTVAFAARVGRICTFPEIKTCR